MVYFCTLFDKHYMILGLAMYESLKKIQIDFHIYIFAFCEDSYKALIDMKLENTTVISLKEFEDEELLKKKTEELLQSIAGHVPHLLSNMF